jgi:hypothetical protein
VKITDNIAGVRDRLRRLEQNIPVAMQRANALEGWQAPAQAAATAALTALAQPNERKHIAAFVARVVAGVLPNGFSLRLSTPFGAPGTLAGYQAARAAVSPRDLSSNLFLSSVQNFEDQIVEWVRTEKDKDARDAGKTDEEIAGLLSWILLGQHDPNSKAARAQAKLTPHIAEYLARQDDRLPAQTVTLWLRAVLAAWRELVRAEWPVKFRAHLRAMKGELV